MIYSIFRICSSFVDLLNMTKGFKERRIRTIFRRFFVFIYHIYLNKFLSTINVKKGIQNVFISIGTISNKYDMTKCAQGTQERPYLNIFGGLKRINKFFRLEQVLSIGQIRCFLAFAICPRNTKRGTYKHINCFKIPLCLSYRQNLNKFERSANIKNGSRGSKIGQEKTGEPHLSYHWNLNKSCRSYKYVQETQKKIYLKVFKSLKRVILSFELEQVRTIYKYEKGFLEFLTYSRKSRETTFMRSFKLVQIQTIGLT